jgi:hypothetical protein
VKTVDIRNAIKALLLAAPAPVPARWSWPNVEPTSDGNPPLRPYAEVTWISADRQATPERPETLKGNEINREVGQFSVAIVAERGAGETAALDHADAIAALLFAGRRITFTGGALRIAKRPDIRPGFPDGPDWRVPVIVRYAAVAT